MPGYKECGVVQRTECSSCFTSITVPSWNVHFTTSVSGDAPCTTSLFDSAVHQSLKEASLTRCQTVEKGALMTADSRTEVEVGIGDMAVFLLGIF